MLLDKLSFRGKELFRKDKISYEVFEITPSRFIETGKALEEVLNQMSACYEGSLRWDYDTKSLVYSNSPIYYEILYSQGKITFNYVIPSQYSKVITNKIDKIFKVAGIVQKEDYFPKMFGDKYSCAFHQSRHFMFSLSTDIRETGLLDGLMSIIDNVQENDNLMIQIGIVPQEDNWKNEWFKANERFKKGEDLKVQGSMLLDTLDKGFKMGDSLFDLVDTLIGVDTRKKESANVQTKRFEMMGNSNYKNAHMTTSKVNWNGYLTSVKIFCDNSSKTRYYTRLFNAVFRILDGDQELKMGDMKGVKGKERVFESQGFHRNIWSTKELCQFLRLPDRRMQMDFKKSMKSIEITENDIPKELLDVNSIPIGETTFKGKKLMTYWNTKDFAMATQHKIIAGIQRSGKTTAIKNLAIEAMKVGHSVFIFDTIKLCETANDVRDFLPPEYADKIVVLDFGNLDYLIPLAWNELVDTKKTTSTREKMRIASHISGNLEAFIDSVSGTGEEEKLKPRMKKFLACASKLVLSQPNTSIKNVLDVLMERDTRDKFIASSGLSSNNIIVQELRRLDDPKDDDGTNYSLVSGIIDRASVMLNDYTMELLLSTSPSAPNSQLNFKYWADNGYCVLIKLSDLQFDRRSLRPLVSFLYSKLWLSMLARGDQEQPRVTHCILDEIHNFPEVSNMLKLTCRESAKFGLSYTFTNHMLVDLRGLLPTIKASGASFLLYKTTKENLRMLEEELMQGNISIEEAMELKKFHSINIINYDRQYAVFTTKALDPVEKRFKKYNRSYLDLKCSKEYGVPFKD